MDRWTHALPPSAPTPRAQRSSSKEGELVTVRLESTEDMEPRTWSAQLQLEHWNSPLVWESLEPDGEINCYVPEASSERELFVRVRSVPRDPAHERHASEWSAWHQVGRADSAAPSAHVAESAEGGGGGSSGAELRNADRLFERGYVLDSERLIVNEFKKLREDVASLKARVSSTRSLLFCLSSSLSRLHWEAVASLKASSTLSLLFCLSSSLSFLKQL